MTDDRSPLVRLGVELPPGAWTAANQLLAAVHVHAGVPDTDDVAALIVSLAETLPPVTLLRLRDWFGLAWNQGYNDANRAHGLPPLRGKEGVNDVTRLP